MAAWGRESPPGSLGLGARVAGARAGVSLPGLCWSILQWVGAGWVPPWGQSLQGCHFGSSEAPATEPGVGKLAMAGAHGGRLGHARPAASPRLGRPRHCAPGFLPLCVPRVPLRLPPESPRPPGNGTFPGRPGSPSGLGATFLRRRLEQLPRSAGRLRWCTLTRRLGPETPAPHPLPLPAPPPPSPPSEAA